MQNAEQILQAIRKMGEKRVPLTRVYRCLFNENLFLAAYNKLYRNDGAMTPGTETDTVDGMSKERITNLIEQLKSERFKFRPSRRIQIEKKSGKGKRPLGIPNFTEKLVQEVLRMILEAYYEPRFRESSHGFRPERGCHTALIQVKEGFKGTVWFIEGDIRGCFDNINHEKLMEILARDIEDGRLLQLIKKSLQAGVIEDWQYHETYSGTPQGGVLSPLLSNIYMHELDSYVEDNLIPQYTKGKRKAVNLDYHSYHYAIRQARKHGDDEAVQKLEQARRQLPSQVTRDPNYRRLQYVRYADDFLLGFIGTKAEAESIKNAIGTFLGERLRLEMSQEKTLITHARTDQARFLGYAVSIYQADNVMTRRQTTHVRTRNINGVVRLGSPKDLIKNYVKRYQRGGKTQCETALLHLSDADIISIYQQRFRGLAEYYKYAVDRCNLGSIKHVMETAMTKTLAHKLQISVSKVYQKYRATHTVGNYEYKTLQVEIPTKKTTRIIYWGAIPLKVKKIGSETINDQMYRERSTKVRSDLIQRLQADTCELCGTEGHCEVHHVRKLANLKTRWAGRKNKPEWVIRMIAMQRKTLIVCKDCHADIHAGRPIPQNRIKSSGEPCAVKAASTVRRGTDGKAS